MMKLEHKCS